MASRDRFPATCARAVHRPRGFSGTLRSASASKTTVYPERIFKSGHVDIVSRGMDRDRFHVTTLGTHAEGAGDRLAQPELQFQFEGSVEGLRRLLTARLREDTTAEDLEVAFRMLPAAAQGDLGLLSLTDRVTGHYIIETEMAVAPLEEFIHAVGVSGSDDVGDQDPRYRVALYASTEPVTSFEMDLLLVYDADGTLRRTGSLIPSGVDL